MQRLRITPQWLAASRLDIQNDSNLPHGPGDRPAARRIMEMATSTCAKCGGHSFEHALLTPIGEDRKLAIVQCANCGTVIGALDPASSTLIEGLQKQIAAIDAGLVRIAKTLSE
jgi:hypothetical protein